MNEKIANKDNPKWQECKRILEDTNVSSSGLSDLLESLDDLIGEIRTLEYETHKLAEETPEEAHRLLEKAATYVWCAEKLTEIVKAC